MLAIYIYIHVYITFSMFDQLYLLVAELETGSEAIYTVHSS